MTNVSPSNETYHKHDLFCTIRFYWIPLAIFTAGMFNTFVINIVDFHIGIFLIILSGVAAVFWTVMRLML